MAAPGLRWEKGEKGCRGTAITGRDCDASFAVLVWPPAGKEGLEFPTQAKAGLNGALLHQGSIYAAAVFSRPSPAACAAAGALKAACKPDPSGVPFPVHGSQPL